MSAKRVLILDTGKEWGGGTNSLIELLKRIDKTKYRFTALFYDNYKRGDKSDIKSEIERLGVDFIHFGRHKQMAAAKMLKEAGRVIFFFSRKLRRSYLFWIDYNFRIKYDSERIFDILKRLNNVDLLYMNNQPSSNLEGIIAANYADIPAIQHSRIVAKLNRFEANMVNKWVKKVICVSQGVKDNLVHQGVDDDKCVVVYNGIDPLVRPTSSIAAIREKWGIGEGEILIGTVGSLLKRKRIEHIIRMFAELVKKHGNIKCMIVGDGPEREKLKSEVLRYRISDKVVFTGFQTDPISYINAMDIFIMTSETEGLPRVILEAMLMAKSVVAYDVICISELVESGRTGFLIAESDISMLAEKVSHLIGSEKLRKEMGDKGREKVIKNFSMDSYVNGVSKVIDEVLAKCSI